MPQNTSSASNSSRTPDTHLNALLPKLTLILAKIAEVLHWALAGVMLIGALTAVIQPTTLSSWIQDTVLGGNSVLSCYGFEVNITNGTSTIQPSMILCFTLGSVIVLSLVAMIFRNVYLILKTAKGKTWFAKGNTPFQQNIVRMFREIGIFFIAVSVMSIISEIVVNLVGGELTTGFNYLSCFIGLVFLCVSQFFNYGARLEKDLDGLV